MFFDPDDKYIWALAVDKAGNVFAATGDKGVIYKITPDGKGDAVLQDQREATSCRSRSRQVGDLIAGTESPGRVFRIDATGKAFVLLDSPFREIHAVRLADDGTIYAVAVNGHRAARPARKSSDVPRLNRRAPPVPTVSTEITAVAVVERLSARVDRRRRHASAPGAAGAA